jgi:hypothetical protein
MVFVTKFDGRKQPFEKSKIVNTCLRMHATQEQASAVADRVEKNVYEGISTKKILQMVFLYLQEFKPEVKHQIDLREAISRLRPKPDFEIFVALLLREYGYSVVGSQILPGKCVTHEIDGVAIRDSEVILVEIKHHYQHHTYTGVDICLETQARLEDLKQGFAAGKHKLDFSKALIACNTKFSDHAIQYCNCMGIEYLGWKAPPEGGMEKMIEEKNFYPITLLKSMDTLTEQKIADNGILTLKQLSQCDAEALRRKTRIPMEKIEFLINAAKKLMSGPA